MAGQPPDNTARERVIDAVRADWSLAQGERQRALLDAEGVPFLATAAPRVDLRVCRIPYDG